MKLVLTFNFILELSLLKWKLRNILIWSNNTRNRYGYNRTNNFPFNEHSASPTQWNTIEDIDREIKIISLHIDHNDIYLLFVFIWLISQSCWIWSKILERTPGHLTKSVLFIFQGKTPHASSWTKIWALWFSANYIDLIDPCRVRKYVTKILTLIVRHCAIIIYFFT